MTVEKKVKVTPADSFPLGKNPDNGPASMYTGFKYPTGGGNDIGVYKQPMENPASGLAKEVTMRNFSNKKAAYDTDSTDPSMTVGIGYNDKVNPRGVGVMRGFGAATKGKKISGKMG
jgi:hypothetical protein